MNENPACMQIAKSEYRKVALAARRALSVKDRQRKSTAICQQLLQLVQDIQARTIAVYAAMKTEVNLQLFIDQAYAQGLHLAFPVMTTNKLEKIENIEKTVMCFFEIPASCYQKAHQSFLSQPLLLIKQKDLQKQGYHEVPPNEFDLVICPLVAFDSNNMRLGYGGGNYDAFLSQLTSSTVVVGVAFEEQRVLQVPAELHDIPLPRIITA